MRNIRCKGRPKKMSAEMTLYTQQIAANNTGEHSRLKRNLLRAIREELTDRQRQVLTLYYVQDLSVNDIAGLLGVYTSTVTRTLHRGEQRLFRCLRYGAERYLKDMEEDEP